MLRLWTCRRIPSLQSVPRRENVPERWSVGGPLALEPVGGVLAADGLDVLIDLRVASVSVDPRMAPSCRTWRFVFGLDGSSDPITVLEQGSGTSPVFANLVECEGDNDRVICCGRFRRYPHAWSQTVDEVLRTVIAWPAKLCRQVILTGQLSAFGTLETTIAKRRTSLVTQAANLVVARIRVNWRSFTRVDEWEVGIIERPIGDVLLNDRPIVRWLGLSDGRGYAADPFGLGCPDDGLLLAEWFDYRSRHGSLIAAEVRAGAVTRISTLVDDASHHSYPQPVEYDGVVWIVPEAASTTSVSAYRLDGATVRDRRTVLDGRALVDPTIVSWDDRWWLIGTDAELGCDTSLHVFWATSPFGPWNDHPANPVKTDAGSSRSAGTPFVIEGVLYRPAQDCSRSYGGAVVINRIDAITADRFSEEPVTRLAPLADRPDGLHHLAAWGTSTLVDGRRDRRSFAYLPIRLGGIVRRNRGRIRRLVRAVARSDGS